MTALGRFSERYEQLCRAVVLIFVVQVAMIVFTVRGLVVVGFFPAVGAALATYRTWLLDDDRSWTAKRAWETFGAAWRADVRQANLLGWPLAAVWVLLLLDYAVVQLNDPSSAGVVVSGILLVAMVVGVLVTVYLWVLRANFDEGSIWLLRTAILMVIARPVCNVMMAATFGLVGWLWWSAPGVLVVFGPAVPLFLACVVTYSFGRVTGMDIRESEPLDGRVPSMAGTTMQHRPRH